MLGCRTSDNKPTNVDNRRMDGEDTVDKMDDNPSDYAPFSEIENDPTKDWKWDKSKDVVFRLKDTYDSAFLPKLTLELLELPEDTGQETFPRSIPFKHPLDDFVYDLPFNLIPYIYILLHFTQHCCSAKNKPKSLGKRLASHVKSGYLERLWRDVLDELSGMGGKQKEKALEGRCLLHSLHTFLARTHYCFLHDPLGRKTFQDYWVKHSARFQCEVYAPKASDYGAYWLCAFKAVLNMVLQDGSSFAISCRTWDGSDTQLFLSQKNITKNTTGSLSSPVLGSLYIKRCPWMWTTNMRETPRKRTKVYLRMGEWRMRTMRTEAVATTRDGRTRSGVITSLT